MSKNIIERVRKLDGWRGDVTLVKGPDGRHFAVSSVDALFSGPETLVFACDERGEVLDWGEVAGGRGMSHEEAIADLAEMYERDPSRLAAQDDPRGEADR